MLTIPQLPARDLIETISFYEKLGLVLGRKYEEPTPYLIMLLGESELHFWPHNELVPAHSNFSCYVRFENGSEFDAVFKRWSEAGLSDDGIPRLTKPHLRPWGMYEFHLVDINGNLVTCGIVEELYDA